MIPDCKWTRPRIIAYLDGEIDEPDEELISEHLSVCAACRAVTEAERAMTARVRAAAGAERAPARLAERIRRGLAEAGAEMRAEEAASAEAGQASSEPQPAAASGPATAEAPAPEPAAAPTPPPVLIPISRRKQPLPRRTMGWSLAAATAAALLLMIGWAAFRPSSGRSLVSAMAAEHYQHGPGRVPVMVDLTSDDSAAIEAYLAAHLGVNVKLPPTAFPATHGATCCQRGERNFGLVACFCERRSHSISLFLVKSEGLSMDGLEPVQSAGRDFWRGSAGKCRAVVWQSGPVCYALVGEFQDPADHLDLASRTAKAFESCPVK